MYAAVLSEMLSVLAGRRSAVVLRWRLRQWRWHCLSAQRQRRLAAHALRCAVFRCWRWAVKQGIRHRPRGRRGQRCGVNRLRRKQWRKIEILIFRAWANSLRLRQLVREWWRMTVLEW